MPRTIYRQPNVVDTDIDTNIKFHSHSNWKGICDDKNYLNIDQETFEDCKNVYMSSDALLKSRPSFKIKNNTEKITKKWVFGDVIFVLDNEGTLIQKQPGEIIYTLVNPSIFQKEGIIFVFAENGIWYYDDVSKQLQDAKDLLYVPEVDIYTDNIKSDTNGESENLLINNKKIIYNYTDFNKIDITNKPSTKVDIKIGDLNYETEITDMTPKVLVDKYIRTLPLSYDEISNKPLISVSKRGNAISCQRLENNVLGYTIYHTTNFLTWDVVDTVTDATSSPKISYDGSLVYYVSDNKIKVKSLIEVNGNYEYPVWTTLFELPEFDDLGELNDENRDVRYYRNLTTNVKILNPNTYIAIYGVGIDESKNETYPCYKNIHAYVVLKGEIIVNKTITEYEDDYYPHPTYNEYNLLGDYLDFDYSFYNKSETQLFVYLTILAKTYRNDTKSVELVSVGITPDTVACVINKVENSHVDFSLDYCSITQLNISDEHVTDKWVPDLAYITIGREDRDGRWFYYTYLNYFSRTDAGLIQNVVEGGHADKITVPLGAISRETGSFITYNKYYNSVQNPNNYATLLHEWTKPVAFVNDKFYYEYEGNIYINELKENTFATFTFIVGDSKLSPLLFEHNCELNEEYISKGNNLYISKNVYDEDGNFKLYFPKIANEQFNKPITNLHPVSENQVAIFFDDEIWYVQKTELGHEYYKSKLQVGLKEGSDVLTSQNGQNIIFSSTRGLVYMSYQELVQSTEQTLTYLSDTIYDRYKEFNTKPVKLFLNDLWLYCYHNDEKVFYIFDVRNNSWWRWEYYYPILNILIINDEPEFIVDAPKNNLMSLNYSVEDYYDDIQVGDVEEQQIDWFIRSQKLHLGTLNYTKNIISMIINNVETETTNEQVSFNLSIRNYRTKISDRYSVPQNLLYKVDMLRTYVKRCNSRKVNEFQYTMTYDDENAIQIPLSIHSIIVKYTVSGQVR